MTDQILRELQIRHVPDRREVVHVTRISTRREIIRFLNRLPGGCKVDLRGAPESLRQWYQRYLDRESSRRRRKRRTELTLRRYAMGGFIAIKREPLIDDVGLRSFVTTFLGP